ncbi:M28 family peptidase [Sphingomonas quercus]|uniref:M28 family peptidase n=1 Tax=Sphingomonas quercus TaxID=2842451 RepID=A0ABS6BKX1_9SPHN|nr:M28 family peptidase [Sphingomonas quercus]MBU3077875.1 M28 family peptidase [Sphingomonas quercus]
MQFKRAGRVGLVLALVASTSVFAQEREDRTLLSQAQMTSIINEVSGDRAMQHVLELVPYQRVRLPGDYDKKFRETQVITDFAKEYGFSNISVETFDDEKKAFQPTVGELWLTTPKSIKLFDIHDIPLSLVSLNANGDLSGELISLGAGRPEDFEGKDVKGKFVLTSGNTTAVYNLAVERGALGVLGIVANSPQRAIDYPRQIMASYLTAKPGTVAWSVTPEARGYLEALMARGEKLTIRSVTKSTEVSGRSEYVHAEIPGDGSTRQEVGISCHLFEGVIKQGANDDNSGCAMILEVGRAYIKLIKEGKLPPPKRTINFQFVPEISGTNAYLNKHADKARAMIGTLNFDMEAIRVAASRSYWILQRTPDTFPSYLNDIAQSMMEYVSDITRERVRFRRSINGYAPTQPVESVHGSKDAFYIKTDKHYGSSDHVTYMQHGIPAVMFITWPDMWYHSSDDTPDKQDPTQYKRAAVVALGGLAALSNGTDDMAARVVAENLARGTGRMGEAQVKGLGYIADATPADLPRAYREAQIAIRHQAEIEKAVIRSANVMWTDAASGKKNTSAIEPLIERRAAALLAEAKATYQLEAAQHRVSAAEPALTAEEREASSLIVKRGPKAPAPGTRGGPRPTGPGLPDEYMAEFQYLVDRGNMTILQMRDFLSGEFTPLSLAELTATLKGREADGLVTLQKK